MDLGGPRRGGAGMDRAIVSSIYVWDRPQDAAIIFSGLAAAFASSGGKPPKIGIVDTLLPRLSAVDTLAPLISPGGGDSLPLFDAAHVSAAGQVSCILASSTADGELVVRSSATPATCVRRFAERAATAAKDVRDKSSIALALTHSGECHLLSSEAVARLTTALASSSPLPTAADATDVAAADVCMLQLITKNLVRGFAVDVALEGTRAGHHVVMKPRAVPDTASNGALGSFRDSLRVACTRLCTTLETVKRCRISRGTFYFGADATEHLWFTSATGVTLQVQSPPPLTSAPSHSYLKALEGSQATSPLSSLAAATFAKRGGADDSKLDAPLLESPVPGDDDTFTISADGGPSGAASRRRATSTGAARGAGGRPQSREEASANPATLQRSARALLSGMAPSSGDSRPASRMHTSRSASPPARVMAPSPSATHAQSSPPSGLPPAAAYEALRAEIARRYQADVDALKAAHRLELQAQAARHNKEMKDVCASAQAEVDTLRGAADAARAAAADALSAEYGSKMQQLQEELRHMQSAQQSAIMSEVSMRDSVISSLRAQVASLSKQASREAAARMEAEQTQEHTTAGAAARVLELETRAAALERALADASARATDAARRATESAIDDIEARLRAEYRATVAAAQAAADVRVTELQHQLEAVRTSNSELQTAAAHDKHEAAVEVARLRQQVQDVTAQLTRARSKQSDETDRLVTAALESHEAAMEELRNRFTADAAQWATLLSARDSEIGRMRLDATAALAARDQAHSAALNTLRAEMLQRHSEEVQALKAAHALESSNARRATEEHHLSQMDMLRREHSAAMMAAVEASKQDAAAERERATRDAQARAHAERRALLEAHDAHLAQLSSMLAAERETHVADVALLRAQLASSSPTALLSSLQAQVTTLNRELAQEREAAAEVRAAAEVATKRDAAEVARLTDLLHQRESAFAQNEVATKTAAQSAVESIVADLEQRMGAEVDAVRAAAAAQVQAVTSQLHAAREELTSVQTHDRIALETAAKREAELTQELHDAGAALATARDQHAQEMQKRMDASAAALSAAVQQAEARYNAAAAEWAASRSRLEAALESSSEKAAALYSHLQHEGAETLERQCVDLTTRFEVELEVQRNAHAQHVAELQAAHDAAAARAAAAAESQVAATVQHMQAVHAAQLSQVLSDAAAQAESVASAAVHAAEEAAARDRHMQQAAHEQRVADMRALHDQQREASVAEANALRGLLAKSVPLESFDQLRSEMEARAMGAVEETVARARDELHMQLQHASQMVALAEERAAAATAAREAHEAEAQVVIHKLRAQVACLFAQREDDAARLRDRILPSALQVHAADAYAKAQRSHDEAIERTQREFQQTLLQTRATADATMKHMQASHEDQVASLQERIAKGEDATQQLLQQLAQSEAEVRATAADADVRIAATRAQCEADMHALEQRLRGAWEEDRCAWEAAAQAALQAAVMDTAQAAETAKAADDRLLHAQYQAQLHQAAVAAQEDLGSLRAELEAKHRASIEAAFSHALADRDASMRAVLEDKASALAAKEAERRAGEDALRSAYESRLAELRAQLEAERRDAQLSSAHALAMLQEEAEAAHSRSQAALRDHLNSVHDAAIAKMHAEVRAAMEAADVAAMRSACAMRAAYERQGMAAEEGRQVMLRQHEAALQAAMTTGVNHAQSEAVAALALLNAEWSSKMTAEMEAVRDDYNSMMAAVRADAEKAQVAALAAAQAAHAREWATQEQSHAARLQELQEQHAQALRSCQDNATAEMQTRLSAAMARAADERARAVAEAASKAAAERERAVESMRDQANAEHENAMDALRMESDALLGNIEGAMGKLRDERDSARQAAMRMQQRASAADGVISSLRGRINSLLQSGALHRLQAVALAAHYVSLLARTREAAKREHDANVAAAAGEWGARVGVLEEQLAAERSRAKVLLEFRAKLLDTLNGFRRDTVLEHKVRTMELASEIASLADAHADLSKQSSGVAAQLAEMEATVRGVEREMGELAKQGVIGEDGTVNVNLTRRKKRLDRDLDAALARLADRRGALDDVRRRLEACERARAEKEDELRGVEADLIATLVQQQRALMSLMTTLSVPPGADAQLGTLVTVPASPSPGASVTFPSSPTSTTVPTGGASKSSPLQAPTVVSSGGIPSPVHVVEATQPFSVPSISVGAARASVRPAPLSMPATLESSGSGAVSFVSRGGAPAPMRVQETKPVAPAAGRVGPVNEAYSRRPKASSSSAGKPVLVPGVVAAASAALPPKPTPSARQRAADAAPPAVSSGGNNGPRARAESMKDATPPAPDVRATHAGGRASQRAVEVIGARSMPTSPSGYEPVIEFADAAAVSRTGSSSRGVLKRGSSQHALDEDDLSDDGLIVS